jgi:hypothetical protein
MPDFNGSESRNLAGIEADSLTVMEKFRTAAIVALPRWRLRAGRRLERIA